MKFTRVFAFMALAGLAGSAYATNGYFSHGYGMKAKGMGGAATAMSDDAFGGANNPASMAFVGNRLDLGVDLFSPRREASRTGSAGGAFDGSADSDSKYFLIPEFGYNHMLNNDVAVGVTVYGNGGMNTNYSGGQINCGGGPANLLCGSGKLGVDLMQLIVAPTAAYKLAPNHSIGISPLIGYQRFKAEGLQAFAGMSSDSTNLTNRGYDDSFGYGVRIGYMGKLSPTVTIGAAYASKMKFDEFSKYKGLFAEQGGFDIPENYNLGVAWDATPLVKLALDYQRINYASVNSIANPSNNASPLGTDNGPGFGWQDINVWKLGVEYKYSQQMTLRAGYNHGDNPIQARDAMFNILAPGVIKDHMTLGFTYTLASGNELTMAYVHAFKNDVTGPDGLGAGGTDKIQMYQNSLGIQYSWKM
ncbi:outer membrane protein transport protein [Thiobacillus sp.]|uniref:OmpP1/FadL family transporter n=1 Tax=Thiobacillus sp. TaxID=924 RepID=UPI001801F9A3|nr:outer membrane protein transport protein [Thiobacillus sp.]MBC2731813.1 long-chain fatty acid transporter [Thiobacillus sp.]MBC2740551.1 outer membrane protein transport protein [Thiobacillus sp.]MBC2758597.1 outer membrane protein transport protein [Thiobacillus sp.]